MQKILLIALLCGSFLIFAKHGGNSCSAVNGVLPMTAACWQVSGWNSASTPYTPTQSTDSVSFQFPPAEPPDSNTRHVNQLGFPTRASISGTVSATISIANALDCFFWQIESINNCCPVPSCGAVGCLSLGRLADARLYIRTSYAYPYDLWWSWSAWTLQNGQATIQAPLTDANWTSHDHSTGMTIAQAAGKVTELGISFGGGCFFHHGVQGTGTFTLSDFRWQ